MRFPFDVVAKRFRFSATMYRAGLQGFEATEIAAPMHGYPDLHALGDLRARCFLVTTGFQRLQQSKITALGIGFALARSMSIRSSTIRAAASRRSSRTSSSGTDWWRAKHGWWVTTANRKSPPATSWE